MRYNSISTSSLPNEGKKSTLTIYTDPDFIRDETTTTSEAEVASIRGELEVAQRALKLQTKRCRQLVAEYTRRLQEKEQQYQSERTLRNDQLAKVLKALLIFEARLKQEQKFISHQLQEKDYLINKQRNEITKLMSSQYCKHCNQYYSPVSNLESLDSSSDYVVTDYHDYQSSTLESLDSSSDTYATISEKDYAKKSPNLSVSSEEMQNECNAKTIYQKNKLNKDSLGRRGRKFTHKKSIGTYFEVLKLRNDSPTSNEDNTSNDYEHFEPRGELTEEIVNVQDRIENIFNNNSNSSINSDCNNTVIQKLDIEDKIKDKEVIQSPKISESIPVFETGEQESNDKWYASGSDQEDLEERDVYRNNPVLECMNQILLRNINDSINSPPKTPNVERKFTKNKRVKFSDEEENKNDKDYYEIPIQKQPNFYESPQSIYSNDYEQILSKSSESCTSKDGNTQEKEVNILPTKRLSIISDKSAHYYDMDTTSNENEKVVRKNKILRTPPALPPKPSNLVSKYKLQQVQNKINLHQEPPIESEPDYCSISELNMPVKNAKEQINVIAEINIPNVLENSKDIIVHKPKSDCESLYDPVVVNNDIASLVSKNIEKFSIQLAKQTPIRTENLIASPTKLKNKDTEIPKLPQVSEIIIPEEAEHENDDLIAHDNYIKNNSQILKTKTPNKPDNIRRPIVMGTSVSNLITGFNNQILTEIQQKPEQPKKLFSSFENLQTLEKQSPPKHETPNFDQYDLSQNFEEFKLEDCEILEEYDIDNKSDVMEKNIDVEESPQNVQNSTRVDLIRATNIPSLNINNVHQLRKKLEKQKSENDSLDQIYKTNAQIKFQNEPTYEHFLECTGLSTKSILTPSRLLSNHKSMLKPKDVKLRSKVKSTSVFERHGSTIKYWSEPYI